ncbi:MAG: acetyl-CoA carboxylase biotin carboxyl carrier protein [Zhenhengia sp.]
MDIKLVKELINEFKDSDLTKVKLKNDEFEIEIERTAQVVPIATPSVAPTTQQVATTQINIETPAEVKSEDGYEVKAPMVGTFYSSSAPDKPEFVTVGSKVKKGDTICIIEAMKLMNEVEADRDGEIVEILVENEEMVEFDQPLFIIR